MIDQMEIENRDWQESRDADRERWMSELGDGEPQTPLTDAERAESLAQYEQTRARYRQIIMAAYGSAR